MRTNTLLKAEQLSRYFPVSRSVSELFKRKQRFVKAVDNVSFQIERGQTLGLVGESGCGKTTTAKMILGLYRPTSGRVFYNGLDLHGKMSRDQRRSVHREIQAVMQDPAASLDQLMRIGTIIEEPLVIHGQGTPDERQATATDLLRAVGLDASLYDSYPHELSGGQQQRVAIARALALRPALIVLDEPVSALDMSVRAQVLNLLKDLQKKFNFAYLFVAHDLSVVRYMCDKVSVMYLGTIVESCDTRELFRNPMHPYTKALLDAVPVPDPAIIKSRSPLKGSIPSPLDVPSGCRFRTRCPMVMDICERVEPELQDKMTANHCVSCHLYTSPGGQKIQPQSPSLIS